MPSTELYLMLSGTMFTIGLLGVVLRRNMITVLMCIEVPGFVLKRLFKRDATVMIDRLTAEITTRGDSGSGNRTK